MKPIAIALVAAAALALTPSPVVAKVPSGTFKGKVTSGLLASTWTMTFYRHGTRFKVKSRFGTSIGRTRFRGSTVIFDRESGLESVCHKKAGKYRYTLRRGILRMRVLRDPCRPRRTMTSIRYRKV